MLPPPKPQEAAIPAAAIPSAGRLAVPPTLRPVTAPSLRSQVAPPQDDSDVPEGVRLRGIHDVNALRGQVYDSVLQAAATMPDVTNQAHTLKLTNVRYDKEPSYDAAAEKAAILASGNIARRLRGTWQLFDNATGELLSERDATVANVPTILRDGSFLRNGSRYVMGVQQRLNSGMYARYKKSGEPEVHVNPTSGTGRSHRYVLEPETGIFKVQIEHANIPLVPLLESMGVDREQMEAAWGKEITDRNYAKQDRAALSKLYDRFVSRRDQDESDKNDKKLMQAKLKQALENIELDPEVVGVTMSRQADRLDADLIMRGTTKALHMLQGKAEGDDRDHLAFARYYSAPDILAERFTKDYGRYRQEILHKLGRRKNLDNLPSGALDKYINAAIFRSGLANQVEDINPGEIATAIAKITRFGEGGLADANAAPEEARNVHPSQLGFIDGISSPECQPGYCEVLTKEGWKAWDTVTADDEFACLIDGESQWRKPIEIVRKPFNGQLIRLETSAVHRDGVPQHFKKPNWRKLQFVDTSTPDHRMWAQDVTDGCDAKPYAFVRAARLLEGQRSWNLDIGQDNLECRILPTDITVEYYSGDVFCAEVPGGLLYTRHPDSDYGVWTGNSLRIGIDGYLAANAMIGSDNKLYTKVTDNRTGKQVLRSPDRIMQGTMSLGQTPIDGYELMLQNGKLRMLPSDQADYRLPNLEYTFGRAGNLVPGKSAMYGQRASMASRMSNQAMSLENPEAPLVQVGVPDSDDESFEQLHGESMGAIRASEPGRVVEVSPDHITLKYSGGREDRIALDNYRPGARKTYLHQTPVVEVGQEFAPGQLLVKSNFTDNDGVTALGTNVRTALMAWDDAWEDGVVVSQSLADRMKVQQAYRYRIQPGEGERVSKHDYLSLFGNRYSKEQLDNIDEDGVIKPGTVVREGDPLLLGTRKRDGVKTRVHKQSKMDWSDTSMRWDHASEGIVTDVYHSDKGSQVVVRTSKPLEDADKLCYDATTEVLTKQGWKYVGNVTVTDEVATLNPHTNEFSYLKPAKTYAFKHSGPMYRLRHERADLLVTENHKLYVQDGEDRQFDLKEAKELYDMPYTMQKFGKWRGQTPAGYVIKSPYGSVRITIEQYLVLMSHVLDPGYPESPSYRIEDNKLTLYGLDEDCLRELLDIGSMIELIVVANSHQERTVTLHSDVIAEHFAKVATRENPLEEVLELSASHADYLLQIWLRRFQRRGTPEHIAKYGTNVPLRLFNVIQQLALHAGVCIDARYRDGMCIGLDVDNPSSYVTVDPCQQATSEFHNNEVYCVQMPKHHVIYVRRRGQPVWCGNSGRFGNKGVVTVRPDDTMPHDKDGRPIEMIISPLAVPSRGNSMFPMEMLLGKIARQTGTPYKVKDFQGQDLRAWVEAEAAKHGVSPTETLIDPKTGREIKDVFTGETFTMALHHLASSKASARGLGTYTADGTPARGGDEGAQAKRFSGQMGFAAQSHGAYHTSREAATLLGNRNDDYWNAFMAGEQIAAPKIPVQYNAFIDKLRAAGINPVRSGTKTQLMALIDSDVDDLAGNRTVTRAETVELHDPTKPIPGGLHDPRIFGDGTRWAAIDLHEPMVNPAYEESVRRILGLTERQFRGVLSGSEEMTDYGSGPQALLRRLEDLDLDKEISRAKADIKGTRKTARDAAVKRLRHLQGLKNTDTLPSDLMITRVPVIPPRLRPIAQLGGKGGTVVHDANFLYKELMLANEVVGDLQGEVDDIQEERLALYDAHKALVGLTEPTSQELRQRGVKGLLKELTGDNPKRSFMQRKLISGNIDTVGRGVVSPDTSLDMDTVGIPENIAFKIYEPYIIRNMTTQGIPRIKAMEHLQERDDTARRALLKEMGRRPVRMARAPLLHKYGDVAQWPRLIKGDAIRPNAMVYSSMGMDNDGDTVNLSVPHSREAVHEAVERMMPSKMLIATSDFKTPMYTPTQDMLLGLYMASREAKKGARTRYFANMAAATAAYNRGEIDENTPIELGKNNG